MFSESARSARRSRLSVGDSAEYPAQRLDDHRDDRGGGRTRGEPPRQQTSHERRVAVSGGPTNVGGAASIRAWTRSRPVDGPSPSPWGPSYAARPRSSGSRRTPLARAHAARLAAAVAVRRPPRRHDLRAAMRDAIDRSGGVSGGRRLTGGGPALGADAGSRCGVTPRPRRALRAPVAAIWASAGRREPVLTADLMRRRHGGVAALRGAHPQRHAGRLVHSIAACRRRGRTDRGRGGARRCPSPASPPGRPARAARGPAIRGLHRAAAGRRVWVAPGPGWRCSALCLSSRRTRSWTGSRPGGRSRTTTHPGPAPRRPALPRC